MRKRSIKFSLLAIFFFILNSCSQKSLDSATKSATTSNKTLTNATFSLEIASGNLQSAQSSTAFANPIVVIARSDGNIAVGQTIKFVFSSTPTDASGQSLSAASAVTDSEGKAKINVTSGNKSGAYQVTASLDDKSVVFGLIVESGSSSSQKVLRVVAAGSGDQPVISAQTITLGASLSVKAAIYTSAGVYVSDAIANWSLLGGGFADSDISPLADTTTVFTPSKVGVTKISATYAGTEASLSGIIASTALLTTTATGTPTTIALSSGNNQSGTVNGILAAPLAVVVKDQYVRNLPGVSITCSATLGGGSIVSTNPGTTDSSGIASATVRLGSTTVGAQMFRCYVTSNAALYVDFNATAAHASPSTILWSTQPANSYANAPFGSQPILIVKDSFGNTATSASGTVTLTAASGCGSLTGTATANVSSGIAVFSGAGCGTAGAAVLTATFGAVTGNSNSFTVNGAPPGACNTNDAYFSTAGGGCKDLASGGLVWSARSASIMDGYNAIWDQAGNVANNNTQDANDYGRTNDWSGAGYDIYNLTPITTVYTRSSTYADSSSTNYCHSLVEGGQSDWRMPTAMELYLLQIHSFQAGAAGNYLNNSGNLIVNSSTTVSLNNPNEYWRVNILTGAMGGGFVGNNADYTYCVRGDTRTATPGPIVVNSAPTILDINGTFFLSNSNISVYLTDANGNIYRKEGVPITVSTNLGTISGTTTVNTSNGGIATFSNFTLDTLGSATLTFSGGGFTAATTTVTVKSYSGSCLVENASFTSTQGGCKDLSSGKVWSGSSATPLTWYQAIWGESQSGGINDGTSDSDDGTRTHDYDPLSIPSGSYVDQSTTNYCHSLVEGGKTDWRVPTEAEFTTLTANGGAAAIFKWASRYFWSSATDGNTVGSGGIIWSSTIRTGNSKTNTSYTICIRP